MQLSPEFQGGVFSDSLEGGRAGVTLMFNADGVVGTTRAGEVFKLAFHECELELGGASGRMWFLKGPEGVTLYCDDKRFGEALTHYGRRGLGDKLERLLQAHRADNRRVVLFWLSAAVGFALLLAGLFYGLRQAGSASIAILPKSLDEKLGDFAIDNMDVGGSVVDDPVLTQAVERIMQRLVPNPEASPFKFKPRVVEASTINAFALPGGPMVVYTGLIRTAETPEQLAGVLAHEMAHVTRRHGMQRIAQSLGVVAGIQLLFGDVTGVAAVAVEVLRLGAVNSYGRDQEHESDMDAVRTMVAAQIDPRALAEFFEILRKKEGAGSSLVAFLGTHPDLSQRIRDVELSAEKVKLGETKPLLDNWAEVQKHAGKRDFGASVDEPAQHLEAEQHDER